MGVRFAPQQRLDVAYLGLATGYSFLLPLKGSISPLDALILVGLFAACTWRVSRLPSEAPRLVGRAEWIGSLPRGRRRLATAGLFLYSGVVLFACAEPFAAALIHAGSVLGVDEFLLAQWRAPLASEAPEIIVASLFAWRLTAGIGLGALVSSKFNQWALLVGSLPLASSLAGGRLQALPLDERQTSELLLTAAQSLLAVTLLLGLRLALVDAVLLLGLFLVQLLFPESHDVVSVAYLALAGIMAVRGRRQLGALVREGVLGAAPAQPAAFEPKPVAGAGQR